MGSGLLNLYFWRDGVRIFLSDFRLFCLLSAFIIYAFLSSPTPDNPGAVEVIIALFLVAACAQGFWQNIRQILTEGRFWQVSGFTALIYGLSVSLVISVIHGQEFHYMIRDVLPFIFLFLPLFITDLFVARPERARMLVIIYALMGAVMAARSIVRGVDFLFFDFSGAQELYYLANVPTVLFAACLFLVSVMRFVSAGHIIRAGVMLGLFGVCFAAISLALQRAGVGYLALYGAAMLGFVTWRRPLAGAAMIAVFALLALPMLDVFANLLGALAEKTRIHGLNMREAEWAAVWQQIHASPLDVIFGRGWGATFESPAVSGARVNFTHSLISSTLLKTGAVGVMLMAAYLAGLAQMLWVLVRRDSALALAIAGPLLIDVFLYAAYKSLDFGMLLLIIPAALLSGQRREIAS